MLPGPIDARGASLALQAPTLEKQQPRGSGFAELAADALRGANQAQNEAQAQAKAFAAGEGDVVETLLALSRADLSLRFVVSLRNRALEAYNEIMRLQV